MVLGRRRHRGRYRPLVAIVPAPVRPGTHLPAVQTDPGLDPPETAHPAGSGPLDLADHRRAHPTTPGPTLGRGPTPPLGTTGPTRTTHPSPRPPRFRNIRPTTALPAAAPKPTKSGPGRPPGSRNRRPAPRHDVGKTVKRDLTITAHKSAEGREPGGLSPPGSHRTERDSLPSLRSSHLCHQKPALPPPVREQAGISIEEPGPPCCAPLVGA
jgi:hypothetical protein